jgi:plastocyanin
VVPDGAVDLTGSAQVTVVVTDNAFTDRIILVSPGTEVAWVNEGRNDHNVRPAAEGPGPGWFAEVDVGALADGGSGSVTFDGVGDFPYFCSFHGTARRGQRGRVMVVAG